MTVRSTSALSATIPITDEVKDLPYCKHATRESRARKRAKRVTARNGMPIIREVLPSTSRMNAKPPRGRDYSGAGLRLTLQDCRRARDIDASCLT